MFGGINFYKLCMYGPTATGAIMQKDPAVVVTRIVDRFFFSQNKPLFQELPRYYKLCEIKRMITFATPSEFEAISSESET